MFELYRNRVSGSRMRFGLRDRDRPLGVFVYVGATNHTCVDANAYVGALEGLSVDLFDAVVLPSVIYGCLDGLR